ncbi:TspO/MBR family protein [Pseudaminobacter sp. NGMCC 1.201702]|uniref:TspO/MBR family protein n=1 Tax=Pseudaminobacter sp. NGMCC 1.201702 TaxID=3391825 RepID=UPI0039F0FC65
MASLLALLGFGVASFAAGIGGIAFRPGEWYQRLNKPSWRPPDWLFGPVWTFLYLTIALAGWLVWQEAGFGGAELPLSVYGIQLLLNAAWSPIVFGLHRIGWALAEMVFLWLSIVATIILFYPIHTAAAALLVPYLCWVSFALLLNLSVWRRNSAIPS